MPSILSKSAVLLLLLSSCTSPLVPDAPPDLEGIVVASVADLAGEGGAARLHVKENSADPCGIILTILSTTDLSDSRGGAPAPAGTDAFTVGASVRVWHGDVADSCPAQSVAEAVERVR